MQPIIIILLILTLTLSIATVFLMNQTISMIQKQTTQSFTPPKTVVLFNRTGIFSSFYSLNVSEYRKVWIYYQGVQGDVRTDWGVSFGLSNLTQSDVLLLPDVARFSISDEIPRTLGLDIQGPYLFINCEGVGGPGQNNTNSMFLYLT